MRLYGQKWYEYFEFLLPELSHEQHLLLQQECFNLAEQMPTIVTSVIQPNDYAHEVIERIKGANHSQIIISNTPPDHLEEFIKSVGIDKYFTVENAFGLDAHRKASSKIDKLKEYLDDKNFEEIIIVGDSQKDIDLATAVGGKSYYYSHPHVITRDITADFIISDLREILNEL